MPVKKRKKFPCDSCGICCQNVHLSEETSHLDRGDGTCVNFSDSTRLCNIYESRPLICRVEDYYNEHLSHSYEWDAFIEINISICEKLKNENY